MNTLLAYQLHEPNFVNIIVIVILAAVALYAITIVKDAFLQQVFRIVIVVAVVLGLLFCFVGCTKDSAGKYHLDTGIRDQLLAVAQAQAHLLASEYLQTGHVDFKKDLISGALSQVYTLEGTANAATQANVATVVGNVIKDPNLKAAVTDAAIKTIDAAPKGQGKDAAINGAIVALDTAIAKVTAGP